MCPTRRTSRERGPLPLRENKPAKNKPPFSLTTIDTIEYTMDTIVVPIVKTIVAIVVKSHPVKSC